MNKSACIKYLQKNFIWISAIIFLILVIFFTLLFIKDYAYPRMVQQKTFCLPINSQIFSDWGGFIGGVMAFGAFIFAFLTFLEQQKSIRENDLENSFFKLMNQLQFILEQTEIMINSEDSPKGRNAMNVMLISLKNKLTSVEIEKYEEAYDEFYEKNAIFLGHYFRFVYHIIKFIDSTELDKTQKQKYMDLLQAQLSTTEMGLIFYNAALGTKAKKRNSNRRYFKDLLDEYNILENIDDTSLLNISHKKKYYPKTFKD